MSDIFISTLSKALRKVEGLDDGQDANKVKEVFKLFTLIIEEATESENINFTTLFSRLAYVGTRENLSGNLLFACHTFRRINEQSQYQNQALEPIVALGMYASFSLLNTLYGSRVDVEGYREEAGSLLDRKKEKRLQFIPLLEVIILRIDIEEKQIIFVDEKAGDEKQIALYDVGHKNEIFTSNIISVYKYASLPIHANLVDVDLNSDGLYVPGAIIIHPDYLVDVTAIAECFSGDGAQPMLYLLRKFMPRQVSAPLMIGNIVNHLLDELVSDPAVSFQTLVDKIFRVAPLQFALYDDHQVKEILMKCYHHFLHMKKVVNQDFKERKIYIQNVYLEPSFYSRQYGIQGRLDLLHVQSNKNRLDIVELKSGKPWRPNTYGLSHNHYTQTLLYDQIMQSTFGTRYNIQSYILYSVADVDQLRYAPVVKAQQWEAAKVRNDLIAIEHQLSSIDQQENHILNFLSAVQLPDAKGFVARDISHFEKVYKGLDSVEKAFFDHYVAFVTREHQLSKTGEHGLNKSNGLAALWLENQEEKEDRFAILKSLEIAENKSKSDPPIIRLSRTEKTNPLANFRSGDIAVLYPAVEQVQTVLHNQIFKCSILEVTETYIEVKLRSKQYNHRIFKQHQLWNIEEDVLDSGFNAMYRSLFAFAASDSVCRRRLLGREAPRPPLKTQNLMLSDQLTQEQKGLLSEVIHARDYYLLWGPPGTGKTSMMLKHYVNYVFHNSEESILLLAYTNRAVDEICAAIEGIDAGMNSEYLRIGSRYGCGPAYRNQLLSQQIQSLTKRKDVKELIAKKRIVVSTVSSFLGNIELLSLKTFDTVVIDEASQILEPMLLGLLPQFKKFVLIGDHKQLPAVVRQRKEKSQIDHKELNALGVLDCRMSLFERLYLNALRKEANHTIGILSAQGRMHTDIMAFPNQHFYKGQLKTISKLSRLHEKRDMKFKDDLQQLLVEQRLVYIPSHVDDTFNWKINTHEARLVTQLIEQIESLYQDNDKEIGPLSIGVITPYRAQIAQIKAQLADSMINLPITVDTVERYQGGARDIIILSLCTNRLSQLDALVSLSAEGVDRKLNVALTRAREQIFILGNEEILSSNETYNKLIRASYRWRLES